ncbi:hypothetical protein D9M68_781570 [compost metagenome]
MPKRPMTAIRKLTPLIRVGISKVSRRSPEIVSMPTEASAKPSIIETSVLNGDCAPMEMKLAKARK